ncbi:hypothetical protein KSP40_PGU001111 [Platanthera guangdongensis]|uniref:Uncharacterized protein n=1 Tax=Platanthera guangdongensis TaxID=2320717 RepID=A0ABR2LY47_9ASPA
MVQEIPAHLLLASASPATEPGFPRMRRRLPSSTPVRWLDAASPTSFLFSGFHPRRRWLPQSTPVLSTHARTAQPKPAFHSPFSRGLLYALHLYVGPLLCA